MKHSRKEWILVRLLELSLKEDKDVVDIEEEAMLEQELKGLLNGSEENHQLL